MQGTVINDDSHVVASVSYGAGRSGDSHQSASPFMHVEGVVETMLSTETSQVRTRDFQSMFTNRYWLLAC